MAPRVLGALALFPAAAAAVNGSPDLASIHSKCYSLLAGLSASQYSADELALLCRSRLPTEICRAEAKELGAKPWSPSTIGRVCGKWEEDWTERTLQMSSEERQLEYNDFQKQVDEIMKGKAAVGLCVDQTVDECAAYKREEYPKYTKQLNDAYREKRASGRSGAEAAEAEAKEAVAEEAAESPAESVAVEAASEEAAATREMLQLHREEGPTPGRATLLMLAAGAVVLGLAVAAAFFFKRNRAKQPDSESDSDAELSQ